MIEVRRKQFDFSNNLVHWFGGNKLMTHTMNALSLLFPQGERFFVESVRNYREMITDDFLKNDIKGFIGQEAMHSLQHLAMNNAMTDHGIDINDLDEHIQNLFKVMYKLPKSHKLAITCALEHITAMMASLFLERDDLREMMTNTMQELWVWHSVEETEHKSVAFDVYSQVSNNYPLRSFYLIISTIGLIVFTTYLTTMLMIRDETRAGFYDTLCGFNTLWGLNGAFTSLIGEWFTYFNMNHHPWDKDNSDILDKFKKDFNIS